MRVSTLGVLIVGAVLSARAEVVIVVNKANPVATLSRAQVTAMLLGSNKKWPGGAPVSVITTSPGDPERKAALSQFVGMTEQQFATALIQANFKGEDRTPPKTLPSGKIIVQVVSLTPGAIGLIDSSDVVPGVKRVSVE